MGSVWIVEDVDAEQRERGIFCVGLTLDDAMAAVKETFAPPYTPYIVEWDAPQCETEDQWTLTGQFEAVPGYSIRHVAEFYIQRYDVHVQSQPIDYAKDPQPAPESH